MQTISATELARNTREILDKVVSQGETVEVQRNQILIAQIIPPPQTMNASQALAGISFPVLTATQARGWLNDSKESFHEAVRDPWA
jgi:antitoxin (DNA-binding transcriptional repressor) of toxin-antitoxin stability system